MKEYIAIDKYYDLFPTVSLKYLNEQVKFNFGNENNFVFDIEGYCFDKSKVTLKKLFSIETSQYEIDYIIKEYMCFSGYFDTYKNLDSELSYNEKIQENSKFLQFCKSKSENKVHNKKFENDTIDGINNMNIDNIQNINIDKDNIHLDLCITANSLLNNEKVDFVDKDNKDIDMNTSILRSFRKFSEEIENSDPQKFDKRGISMIIDRKTKENNTDIDININTNMNNNDELNNLISVMYCIEEKNCKKFIT